MEANSPGVPPERNLSVAGVLFFGVPHFGSPLAGGDPKRMSWFSDVLATPLLKDLATNSPALLDLDRRFCSISEGGDTGRFRVASFGETQDSDVALRYKTMVERFRGSARGVCVP